MQQVNETAGGGTDVGGPATALPQRLDFNLLTVFEAVWAERHIGHAAERLALSQPATSHALARLRAAVGDPLFERAPGGVRPTPRAEAMWADVARALAHARTAMGRGFDPTRLGRRLSLGMTANVALTLLPRLLPRLRDAAPDLDLAVRPVDRRSAPEFLARGRIDAMAGLWEGELPAAFVRRRLYEERLVLVARSGHPALNRPLTPAALAALPQVLVSPSGEAAGPVDRALARQGLSRRIALVVADWRLAAEAVAATDLVAALAEGVVERLGPSLGLGSAPLPLALDPVAIDLVAPAGSATLADWLVPLMAGDLKVSLLS